MKYNELVVPKQTKARRSGRGIAAGRGKTAGRGTKGQGARKSGGVRPGFEGGQMPLYMRLPKLRGFTSHAKPIETVQTGQLQDLKKSIVDNFAIFEAGLITSPNSKVKLIVKGEITSKLEVKLQSASNSAIEMLNSAGGSFTATDQIPQKPKSKKEAKV